MFTKTKNRQPVRQNGTPAAKGLAKRIAGSFLLLCTAGFALGGCGSSGGGSVAGAPSAPAPTAAVVSGVAATGAPLIGNVLLKDSSSPALERSTTSAADGSFSFDVTGLTPPFILKASGMSGGSTVALCSFAAGAGTANVNPFSNAAVANAAGGADPAALYATPTPTDMQTIASNLPGALTAIRTQLKPLLDQFNADVNPVTDPFTANHTGLDAVFDAVTVRIGAGNMVVANRQNNATIFSAPVHNIAGGQMIMANMPAPPAQQPAPATPVTTPAPVDGAALYASKCASCHRQLASSNKKGTTAAQIQAAITNDIGNMGILSGLTDADIQAIANVLGGASTPSPVTPSPTPPVSTSPPASNPNPAPVDGTALYNANCQSCHGQLNASGKRGATAAQIQVRMAAPPYSSRALTPAEVQAIADVLAVPSTPVPPSASNPAPTVDPGKVVYDSRCASCHRVGTYDASGSAPNLSRAGTKVDGKFTAGLSGHKSITLTAADIANLKTFLNAN